MEHGTSHVLSITKYTRYLTSPKKNTVQQQKLNLLILKKKKKAMITPPAVTFPKFPSTTKCPYDSACSKN
jgi:hypothetical protein